MAAAAAAEAAEAAVKAAAAAAAVAEGAEGAEGAVEAEVEAPLAMVGRWPGKTMQPCRRRSDAASPSAEPLNTRRRRCTRCALRHQSPRTCLRKVFVHSPVESTVECSSYVECF